MLVEQLPAPVGAGLHELPTQHAAPNPWRGCHVAPQHSSSPQESSIIRPTISLTRVALGCFRDSPPSDSHGLSAEEQGLPIFFGGGKNQKNRNELRPKTKALGNNKTTTNPSIKKMCIYMCIYIYIHLHSQSFTYRYNKRSSTSWFLGTAASYGSSWPPSGSRYKWFSKASHEQSKRIQKIWEASPLYLK